MILKENKYFYSDGQLENQISRCEYCEEKPCRDACPANCSPADFIMAVKKGEPQDYMRSAAEILRNNPLGGTCGMVCPDTHCMASCTHLDFDFPVDIPTIQAKIIQKANELGVLPEFKKEKDNGKKIAIIGAGPSGLSAAAILGVSGYTVDIYESTKKAGGAAALIPKQRLLSTVLQNDINFILSLGNIKILKNKKIKSVDKLFEKGYDAVIAATGVWDPIKLGIKNEDLAVYSYDY
ncbi:MAG: NAD(P)-binding protein, partial [Actinomycetia bacterium]|nr:NAD(P)-binding protein [Actinomycetes bacterium]